MSDFALVIRTLDRVAFACRALQVEAADTQISAHQAQLLSYLDERDPTMVGELAEHMGVTPSTMSLTLKRLEGVGLVRRDRDPADRRVVDVRLTEEGTRVRDAHSDLDAERVERMLSLLDPGERRAVVQGLALLADAADDLVRRGRADLDAQLGD